MGALVNSLVAPEGLTMGAARGDGAFVVVKTCRPGTRTLSRVAAGDKICGSIGSGGMLDERY